MAFTLAVKTPETVYGDTVGHLVEVEVTTSHSDMPKEVFVWHVGMGANTLAPTAAFVAVCSLEQLASLPTAPVEGEEMILPFYRKATASITARTLADAEDYVTELKADLYRLRRDYDASKTLIARTDTV